MFCILYPTAHFVIKAVLYKRRFNLGNDFYHSVQRLLSSRLLSKNVTIGIYKTILLPVVLYGCDTLSLTLKEEHRLRLFENRVLRRIFGPKRDEVTTGWTKRHNEELHNCTLRQGMTKSRKMR
jgi:hypothetical protein